MTQEFAERLIAEHVKPLYGFALRRCADLRDAEDLTQEICLRLWRALLGRAELAEPEHFVWTVARNTLANYYRGKARHGFGALPEDVPDGSDLFAALTATETLARLRGEIAYLSKTQRQIVILHYYENRKQREIADALGIPLGTVKWHLSEARQNLKRGMETMRDTSELKFNPIKFGSISNSGTTGTAGHISVYLRSALAQNILYTAYRKARTVNELADALGVSPVYIESEAEHLVNNGFLLERDGGYLANILIDNCDDALRDVLSDCYDQASDIYATELYDALAAAVATDADGIRTPGGDVNFALWALVPYVIARGGKPDGGVTFEEAATLRPDGGQNICVCTVLRDTPPMKYGASFARMGGPSWDGDETLMSWKIDTEWSAWRHGDYHPSVSERDVPLLRRIVDGEPLSPEEYAYGAKRGLFGAEGLKIVHIDGGANERLLALGGSLRERLRPRLGAIAAPYVRALTDSTPQHMRKARQYGLQHLFHSDGYFIICCLNKLTERGLLRPPTAAQTASLSWLVVAR
ncbi:MAG: RNA polymerase sigma factor [Oscillospiraceae bacterium]|jgi:RNA polymerase sigma factor (sigma-70 family)|nr:RNA polymerase sigma factor [Oscillospiraceae bacterium]